MNYIILDNKKYQITYEDPHIYSIQNDTIKQYEELNFEKEYKGVELFLDKTKYEANIQITYQGYKMILFQIIYKSSIK